MGCIFDLDAGLTCQTVTGREMEAVSSWNGREGRAGPSRRNVEYRPRRQLSRSRRDGSDSSRQVSLDMSDDNQRLSSHVLSPLGSSGRFTGSRSNPYVPSHHRPPRKPGIQSIDPPHTSHASPSTLLVLGLCLILLPSVLAIPPPTPPLQGLWASPTSFAGNLPGKASDSPMSGLPSSVMTVDETILPYIFTRGPEGQWQKSHESWKLYGRQGQEEPDDALPSSVQSNMDSYAVESSLPKGWGNQSTRTNLFRVPLIVVASIVLAILIVSSILFLVFRRKKTHRLAKKRAERERRKALAAQGISEEQINGQITAAAVRKQVTELESRHRAKLRREGKSGMVKVKVRQWTKGLRRRRGGGGGSVRDEGEVIEVIEEEKPIDGIDSGSQTVSTNPSAATSVISLPDSGRRSMEDASRPPSRPSLRRSATAASAGSTTHNLVAASSPATPVNPPHIPHFPPAYRPASVRSYSVHEGPSIPLAGPRQSIEDEGRQVMRTDKTTAPGYYPAPATEESETALAVASRSDGKRPLATALSSEATDARSTVHHVATDDKNVLERMRLGASAPPESSEEVTSPTAPEVHLDTDGFEHVDGNASDSVPEGPRPSSHPDIPAPPPRTMHRSCIESKEGLPADEAHLLPSAPPIYPVDDAPTGPSAPPLEPEEGDAPQDSAQSSAPPAEDDDDDLYE